MLSCFWMSVTHASEISPGFMEEIESKQLTPYFQKTSMDIYAEDFGHIVHKIPFGVFVPETLENLQKFLPIARGFNVKVTCRGNGNSTYGQSQTDGIVIDLRNLQIAMQYSSDDFSSVFVPSSKTWFEVTEFTRGKNMTVPVVVDKLDLTVGGTLSFGAIGGSSYRCGSGADNVLSLEIVTMDGEFHRCSELENRELFDAVLCGIGQFGIMVRANILLIPAKEKVNFYKFTYSSSSAFLREQKALYESKVFDYLKGSIKKNGDAWRYNIEATTYYDDLEDTSVSNEVSKLSPDTSSMETMTYFKFINLVTNFLNFLKDTEKLNVPHPWYNVFMPEHAIEEHLALVLNRAAPYLQGIEPIIVYPMDSCKFKRPLFMKPDGPTFYLLGVFYNLSPLAEKNYPFEDVLRNNVELYQTAKAKGGCRYPIDSIPFTKEDWREHYREKWETVCSLKQQYDPQNLLATGVEIF